MNTPLPVYGPSVRGFFEQDLKRISRHGVCLLPEWICESMVQAARAAHWQPAFYAVLPPGRAEVALQMDLDDLQQRYAAVAGPKAVLLAHPMGYVDPHCAAFANGGAPSCPCFIDWSQSYGSIPLQPSLSRCCAAYVSFNGNKLIGDGGAVRLTVAHPGVDLGLHFARVARLKRDWLQAYLQDNELTGAIQDASWGAQHHSSPMRTVLQWHRLPAAVQGRLRRLGMVQPLLENPRADHVSPSHAYQRWHAQIMLMFSSPRAGWIEHA
ncbi:Uncharacterised protein [Bordetella ansorpii]|uniref:Uncharacterized protein n=1 Tax=Bordetella ansorpii TaxID=288768 RepID=A0A157QN55_9BORD|nr:hypothetical protein [Bordetella ansorpii]SAI47006.1 Uncharacterised protein [Bordetella ansorpii]